MAGNEGISPGTGRQLGAGCSFRQQYKKSGRPRRGTATLVSVNWKEASGLPSAIGCVVFGSIQDVIG